ncbi:MAG: hypothetical protein IKS41_01350 [Alphaproteobacteria bacterium]|nr:hypothetical protein [Alphaproteobacteria bacterium]
MKKSKIFIFSLLVGIGLTACSHYTELYQDENGHQIYRATCKQDITNCYQVANSVCPDGFIPMEWYGKRSHIKLDDSKDTPPDTFGVGNGRMVFRCKK